MTLKVVGVVIVMKKRWTSNGYDIEDTLHLPAPDPATTTPPILSQVRACWGGDREGNTLVAAGPSLNS